MPWYLGIDTSNYTSSVAAWNSESNEVLQEKRLLPVKEGELGVRQSDAVFLHTAQLGSLIKNVLGQIGDFLAVGVSTRPSDKEGSYMPCFLVGKLVAESMGAVNRVPVHECSHQSGHIAAAIYSTNRFDLVGKKFVAFHLSGGTTECLLVEKGEVNPFDISVLYRSLDLYAGQAVDRVGSMLGLPFPSGKSLEELALTSKKSYSPKPYFKNGNSSLSGLENQCKAMLEKGKTHMDIARYCFDWLAEMVSQMTENVLARYPDIDIVYAGGVMSNSLIREKITVKHGGYFAQPQFSSDNAVGVAILAGLQGGANAYNKC